MTHCNPGLHRPFLRGTLVTAVALALTACGGGSSSSDDGITVSGTVSAPQGTVAFDGPSTTDRLLAALLGAPARAALSDVVSPVPGVEVGVYEVDKDGNIVGDAISSTTTDGNGEFTLEAPAATGKYIVRATGSTGNLDARITGTEITVDPATDAASDLITELTASAGSLDALSVDEIEEIENAVDALATRLDTTNLDASALSTALKTEAKADEETLNLIRSTAASGSICGKVTDSSGTALANIRIVARDYANWVTRAKARTDASGQYCLNVPVQGDSNPDGGTYNGQYILAAFNRTSDSGDAGRHASEWWSSGGTAYNAFDAEKIEVTSTSTLTRDFQLEAGGRIQGTVVAGDSGAALDGVKVVIRDFDNRTLVATARVKSDGSYRVNVAPGKYLVVASNRTARPYATEIYDGASGTNDRNLGTPLTVTQGSQTTLTFSLEAGYRLKGAVTDGGNAVTGRRVMINVAGGGPAERLRTDKQGRYAVWLKPDNYKVYVYGQKNTAVDMTASNQTVPFSGSVSTLTATVKDSSGNPVSQAKVRLYDSADTFLGFEITNSDGTVTLNTDQTGSHKLVVKIDREAAFGTTVYNGQTQFANATAINVASAGSSVDLGNITLPDAGVLRGTVYAGSSGDTSTPMGGFSVEVRSGGTAGTNQFVRTGSRGDGSFVLSLPAGTYERVKMRDATSGGNCDNVTISAGQTTTIAYYDGDDTCVVQ